jgi:Bacterial pre-peptidase C-terminal domain
MFKDLAGNNPAQAYDFGSPKTAQVRNRVKSAFVGTNDLADFYRFTLLRSSSIDVSLRNLDQGNADLQIWNQAGKTIASSQRGRKQRETIATELSAGTYFIRVFPQKGDVTYRLILTIAQKFSS